MFATLYFIIFTQLNNDTDAWDGKDYGGIALPSKKKKAKTDKWLSFFMLLAAN